VGVAILSKYHWRELFSSNIGSGSNNSAFGVIGAASEAQAGCRHTEGCSGVSAQAPDLQDAVR